MNKRKRDFEEKIAEINLFLNQSNDFSSINGKDDLDRLKEEDPFKYMTFIVYASGMDKH